MTIRDDRNLMREGLKMGYYIDLFREQLGSDDMHNTPFLDAAHKILEELEQWQRNFHERCDVQLDEFRKRGMTEAAERCIEIAEQRDKHVAMVLRKEFPLPKAGILLRRENVRI